MELNFKNRNYHQLQRKENLSSVWIQRVIVLSSFLAFFSFFTAKFLRAFHLKQKNLVVQSSAFSKNKSIEQKEQTHVLPILVNLKGEEGPQLVRMQVHITIKSNSLTKEFLSKGNKLEKHLLFVLSGQKTEDIYKRKNHFERQIRSQINAFLSKDFIGGIRIQTEMLN